MSLTQILNQVDENKIKASLKKLKIMQIEQDLFSSTNKFLSNEEMKTLAETASVLALSSNTADKSLALEIATSLPSVSSNKGIFISSILTLRKLGNYPAINLLETKNKISEYKELLYGISYIEEYIMESLNERDIVNKTYLLTNFQKKIYDLFNLHDGLSISAPTSAGKSFILMKNLVDYISKQKLGSTIIYIVPTRALINQVMNDFFKEIIELDLKDIYIGCSSEIDSIISQSQRLNILVLTQERLFQLCTKEKVKLLNVKFIVIDEAHNIQSGGRGILLESALKNIQTIFPDAKLLFSSPLVSNPEKFLDIFKVKNSKFEKNDLPLVNQNMINVVKKPKELQVRMMYNNENIEISKIPFNIKKNNRATILANVALKLWNNHTSIIYSSEPMISANVARELIESKEFKVLNNEKLDEFADFIEEYISKHYELAYFIRCGIAFHFGALPPIIRSGIEELFKSGELKIVCCTSTLLEGVNMPAKNIFLYQPESGRKPLVKLNFWNLVGRAGRMGNDFSGNIFFIDIEKWKVNPLNDERSFPVISSSEAKLVNHAESFKAYINDRNKPSGLDDYSEQLVSMVISDRIRGSKLENSIYLTADNEKDLIEIDTITEKIIEDFIPPQSLLKNIQGVMPERINDLWNHFQLNKEEYDKFIPKYPVRLYDTGYDRFKEIVSLINIFFMNDTRWNDRYQTKISIVSTKWMTEDSLSNIVFQGNAVNYRGKELTSYVKNEMEFLNNTIRFKMVKYFQVYLDVLKAFLISINKNLEAEKLLKLSSFLEFGASSIAALEFMSLGIPREAALKLSKKIPMKQEESSIYYQKWLKEFDVTSLDIPRYLQKQLLQIQYTL
ncbi:DEAD/DEAH box helicase [Exiguobacterium sp. BG5(2022)]|uniref:DEAD/DEAH box helicase n=1 Tax=Exiguobacterium sp. BG5(2022) TaxID=2962595 RepID=UPI0028812418|nr:DEAD/DEAH box helicase [Exiguobacterium sp. BG5(2022)]MDT0192146.1 DEAD/DEAH box helicase [Exiguobacterium sp. BG5(2022)]